MIFCDDIISISIVLLLALSTNFLLLWITLMWRLKMDLYLYPAPHSPHKNLGFSIFILVNYIF